MGLPGRSFHVVASKNIRLAKLYIYICKAEDEDVTGDNTRITMYTTALDMYDLDSTVCLDYKIGQTVSGRSVRYVSIDADDLLEQQNIYVSNLESALTEHDWKCEIQFGNVISLKSEEVA